MTGHKSARSAQAEKALVISFCKDHGIKYNETAATIILTHNDKTVEVKPKTAMITDKSINQSERYYNVIAKLRLVFNIFTQH